MNVRAIIGRTDVRLLISAASLWEIAIKSGLGKLELRLSFQELIEGAEADDFSVAPIELNDLITLKDLPHHHRDPFDRLIIAQTIVKQATLITADRKLADYGVPIVW